MTGTGSAVGNLANSVEKLGLNGGLGPDSLG